MAMVETKIGGPVYLYNMEAGSNLKIHHPGNALTGGGKWAQWAKWKIRPTNHPGLIRLSSWADPRCHIKIAKHGGPANARGGIAKWSLLKMEAVGTIPGVVTIASAQLPSHHVGLLPNGQMKPASETGRGKHGQFAVVSGMMWPNAKIHLHSLGAGGNVAANAEGKIHAAGGGGKWAKWHVKPVSPRTPQIVQLQHHVFKGKYLAIGPQGKVRMGSGGKWCNFYARFAGKHKVCLRPVAHMGKRGLGFAGKFPKPSGTVGMAKHGQFRVTHW